MKKHLVTAIALGCLAAAPAHSKTISYTFTGVTTYNIVTAGDFTAEFPVGTPWTAQVEWDNTSTPLYLSDVQGQYRLTKFKITLQGVSGPWISSALADKPSFTVNYVFGGTQDELQFTSGWGPECQSNPTIENLKPYSISVVLVDPTGKAIPAMSPAPSVINFADWSSANSHFKIYLNNEGSQRIYGEIRSIKPTYATNSPDISVQQPAGSELTSGKGSRSFGTVNTTSDGVSKTFVIRNTGKSKLTGLGVSKTGGNKGDFRIGGLSANSLAPAASAKFKVTFKPTGKGERETGIRIASNDPDENPFKIRVSGLGK